MAISVPKEWWRGFFDPRFYTPADVAHVEAAGREVRFVVRQCGLKRGAAVLDLCCGPGRHSLPLARKGLLVTGLDYSRAYLGEARAKARRARVDARFVRGDMRKLRFAAEFDAAVNLFTSFGYFDKWRDNAAVLAGLARALKPGGLLLMEMMNADWLKGHFRSRSWQRQDRGVYQLEENELARGGRQVRSRWIRIFPDGRVEERGLALWLFDRRSLSALLRAAGFVPLKFWGSMAGDRLSKETNRLIVLARKAPVPREGRARRGDRARA
ncbi:MAG: class I SAM-dependent methyltransferase [Elusimicrobia bacterium]|nr:class I SAM-dependent methyltransferase [Elusimicrobiota bacterium]